MRNFCTASLSIFIFSVLYFLWSGWSAFAVSPSRLSLSLSLKNTPIWTIHACTGWNTILMWYVTHVILLKYVNPYLLISSFKENIPNPNSCWLTLRSLKDHEWSNCFHDEVSCHFTQGSVQAPNERVHNIVIIVLLSHTRTVVRECCKGDDASQWENGKFDPLPCPNPLTDRHKKLHTWLRPGYLPTCKI